MDRHGLCEALRAAGVPPGLYEVPDCPGPPGLPRPEARLYLEERAGEWVVGAEERGVRTVLDRFPDEDRACRSLYARLTEEGPPPSPPTPDESELLLHDGEGIQRRAREQLARALRAAGRPTEGDADGRPPGPVPGRGPDPGP
ncbi:hypothetical protein ACFV7Q_24885 [Streptomyces sp. NPDC059851]|uniref:hypothetical protein n=1 Tax=Streptomyces sp. NPDC059851 TaxID=3346971 RepID=UPI00364DDDB4